MANGSGPFSPVHAGVPALLLIVFLFISLIAKHEPNYTSPRSLDAIANLLLILSLTGQRGYVLPALSPLFFPPK